MATGIKLLVVAKENSGKTTLISKITDGLVVSTDNKAFTGKVPHFRYAYYNGIQDFIATVNDKLATYQEKYDTLPQTLVIDSVTHLQNNMEKWANDKFTGFNIWSNLGKDILALNSYLEDTILPAGINVIITAHCQFDSETNRYEIASPGSFGKNGSWLSITDNSIFIEIKNGKRIINHTNLKYPCRSTIPGIEESQVMEAYDINGHIEALMSLREEADEYVL